MTRAFIKKPPIKRNMKDIMVNCINIKNNMINTPVVLEYCLYFSKITNCSESNIDLCARIVDKLYRMIIRTNLVNIRSLPVTS